MTTTTTSRAMLAGTATVLAFPNPAGSSPGDPAVAAIDAFKRLLPADVQRIKDGIAKANAADAAADPIFPALDAYRRVQAEHRPGMPDEAVDEWADRWGDALHLVMLTRPTTPAGLAALVGFARAERVDQNTDDLAPLWASLDDATRGMAGLAPWSPPEAVATRPDPIYAAIERHRRAMPAREAACDVSCRLRDDDPRHAAAEAVTDRAGEELDAAGADLAAIAPTTTAGLLALLGYVIGCIEAADDDGLGGDRFDGGNWRLPLDVACDDGGEEHFVLRFLRSLESTVGRLAAGRA